MVFIEETTQVVSNSLGPRMNHIRQSLSKRTYATTSLEAPQPIVTLFLTRGDRAQRGRFYAQGLI
jgi:hypothetical protein